MAKETPLFKVRAATSMLTAAASLSERSTGMNCARRIPVDKMGMRKSSCLIENRNAARNRGYERERVDVGHMIGGEEARTGRNVFKVFDTNADADDAISTRTTFIARLYISSGLPTITLQRISHGNARTMARAK